MPTELLQRTQDRLTAPASTSTNIYVPSAELPFETAFRDMNQSAHTWMVSLTPTFETITLVGSSSMTIEALKVNVHFG
jgi:hypothetical protein